MWEEGSEPGPRRGRRNGRKGKVGHVRVSNNPPTGTGSSLVIRFKMFGGVTLGTFAPCPIQAITGL